MPTRLFLAVLALVAAVLVMPAPAHAADRVCDRGAPDDTSTGENPDPDDNPVAESLRLEQAHALSRGEGIGIAVIDSGVDGAAGFPVSQSHKVAGENELKDGHGTIVAGLAAGPEGVAPGASIIDVRVTDSAETVDDEGNTSTETSMEPGNVAAAIRWLLEPAQRKLGVRVINLSLGFESENKELRSAIRAAVDAGMVVVVAAGNRVEDTLEDGTESEEDSEEAREQRRAQPPSEVMFPATMDEVIAVTALNEDMSMTSDAMLVGPEIDVAAPIFGAQTAMLTGLNCAIGDAGSSWAVPQVSGLAALILAEDPGLRPAQVKTRIEVTASGGYHDVSMDGHGTIQPHEALTADLTIKKDGTLVEAGSPATPPYEAARPEPRSDEFGDARNTMLWWGIGAGGALLVALMLRPLLGRRTR